MDDIVFENLVLHEGEEKILIYVKPILANVFLCVYQNCLV